MLKRNWYVVWSVFAALVAHVVIHMLAYISVNWGGYLMLTSIIIVGRILGIVGARYGYVSISHYCTVCGAIVWTWMWALHATYFQYYCVAWVYVLLVIIIALDKNYILYKDQAHVLL